MEKVKVVTRGKKRRGRGYGSGKGGHTTGRGQKGQKSRRSIGILFEGFKVRKSLIKRLPQIRGKAKFKAGVSPVVINVEVLDKLPAGTTVSVETLIKHGLVDKKAQERGVKVLGQGKLNKKLTVNLPVSASAAKKIEKVSGKVVESK